MLFQIFCVYDSIDNSGVNFEKFSNLLNYIGERLSFQCKVSIVYPSGVNIRQLELDSRFDIECLYEIEMLDQNYRTMNNFCLKLSRFFKKTQATQIYTMSSFAGRTISAELSTRLCTGVIADVICLDADMESQHLLYTRSTRNDSLLSIIKINTSPEIVTFRALGKTLCKQKLDLTAIPVEQYCTDDSTFVEILGKEQFVVHEKYSVAIGIGRGVNQTALNYIKKFAERHHYKLVCSKPLVDNGIFTYEHQVGQSGFTIDSNIYIAVGISGTIQHMLGVMGCKKIIAINSDVGAPIHQYADVSLINDCEILFKNLLQSEA